ncbi:hypothetical protein [uncultured Formosa sp.]|uniref:hypothetical protein n=1 Tax=uncultured Formosa sp. TaxID=255435 RepID=UPI002604024E|nr:hypothetical protein [uncultured Formosa sp.]
MKKYKPSDFHPFDAYKNKEIKNFFAVSLITFAYRNFFKAKQIEKLDLTRQFFNSKDYDDNEKKIAFIKQNSDIAFNALLDYIIISLTFENYMKAKLLLNEFVIHEVNKTKNEQLFKAQKKRPIEIIELNSNEEKNFTELKETTLNYSTLLNNKNYIKYFNIDDNSIKYLQSLNRKRNELHLYMSEKIEFGNSIFDNLNRLKKIVEIDFAVLHNSIMDMSEFNNGNKIPIKK